MTQIHQTGMPLFDRAKQERADAEQKKTMRMSRRGDPATSKQAARKHLQSGARKANADLILDALRRRLPESFTAGEISGFTEVDRVEVGRRMSELHRQALVGRGQSRKCRVRGTSMCTWIYTGETNKETIR